MVKLDSIFFESKFIFRLVLYDTGTLAAVESKASSHRRSIVEGSDDEHVA